MFKKVNLFHPNKVVDRTADDFEKFVEWRLV